MKAILALLIVLPVAAHAADNPAVDAAARLSYGMGALEREMVPVAPIVAPVPEVKTGELSQCSPAVPESFMKILGRLEEPIRSQEAGMPPDVADLPRSEPAQTVAKPRQAASSNNGNVSTSHGITVFHGPGYAKRGDSSENGIKIYRGRPTPMSRDAQSAND